MLFTSLCLLSRAHILRFGIALFTLLLLTACATRPSLSGHTPYQLSVSLLAETVANAKLIPVEDQGELFLGFKADDDSHWYGLQVIDEREEKGINTVLTRLRPIGRFRPYSRSGQVVEVVEHDKFRHILSAVFDQVIPQAPNMAVRLLVGEATWHVWRGEDNQITTTDNEKEAEGVAVLSTMNEQELLLRALAMLEHKNKSRLLEMAPDNPGAIGWVYLPAGGEKAVFIIQPKEHEENSGPALSVALRSLSYVVIRSHLITFLKNPVTTLRRLVGHAQDAVVSVFRRGPKESYPEAPLAQGASMNLARWENTLDYLTRSRSYPGSIDLLIGGEAYFEALDQAFAEAQRRIDIRTYIFDNDAFAVRLAEQLKERSNHLRVRVMMDDLGSIMAGMSAPPGGYPEGFEPPNDMVRYLKKDSNIQARRVGNPWLTGDHVKITLVDSKIGFVGGMNYGAEYRYHWHDMMAKVEGPIVWRLQKEFNKAWSHAGPGGDVAYLIRALRLPTVSAELTEEYPVPLRVLQTKTGKQEILRAHLAAIDRAQRYIYISTPYFSEPAVINHLITARARGVDVRVVLPDEGNHGIMNSVNVSTANQLLENGVKVYMYPGMSHVKAAVFDGWASFGSANFDRLSMKVNQELNLATSHPPTVQRLLNELFAPYFSSSVELKEALPWTWADSISELLAKPL
ncbi:MAG TPA: phosphatidylserine/phosphatidylglycerophosphate/cardiolipin synthase family protein [Alcanivoracaceae bacterium]|nr:phosphatidylserine/phosphatidylglycerophosphate/cardiolipin synthase family protein [Alcanivoracaceae bacterium]